MFQVWEYAIRFGGAAVAMSEARYFLEELPSLITWCLRRRDGYKCELLTCTSVSQV